ncbi:MAG TPA: heme-binding protein [Candidatus Acidoferrum sp.]|nr:heme-binding protein [Candidatus Acidoferrum sp.]
MEDRLGLELAQRIVEEAKKKAEELHIKEDIALVNAGGNLKAFARMDGAWLGSIDIAIRKARTARLFDMETAKIGKMSQPGEPLYGIEFSNGGLISFAGGIPLEDQAGTVIGAIGVSGSTVENDVKVAEAGVDVCRRAKFATA